ncbi:hypothetical protein PROFUN_10816 [Planoprotostelium fungivorum]|uniref:Uncharacterized protein n=1 Tax=Planoprotostelium fungivorum TaxID=1890364 RepID=A0A2P6NCM3_9EUKA|nr:hypothetical protein PROFUN_10816 [Planoprotostelium fungivorum]
MSRKGNNGVACDEKPEHSKHDTMNQIEFSIDEQTSIAQDHFRQNGVETELHVVAKAIPFIIGLAADGMSFHDIDIHIKLFYDDDLEEEHVSRKKRKLPSSAGREVEAPRSSPLEHVTHINEEGNHASVEIKINVLSSQHEGSYFRVRFLFTQKDDEGQVISELHSNPIKVVSKRKQATKAVEKLNGKNLGEESEAIPPPATLAKKSQLDHLEIIAESLLRLERQQQEQSKLVLFLAKDKADKARDRSSTDVERLVHQMTNFVSQNSLDATETRLKIRRTMTDMCTPEEVQALVQLGRVLQEEGGER